MNISNASATTKTSSPFASWRPSHAAVRVPNFDEAVSWYTTTLDFRLLQSTSIGKLTFGFLAPATGERFTFEILAGPGAAVRPPFEHLRESYDLAGWHHIGIQVDDVDASISELERRGVSIIAGPRDVPALGLRIAFFADPWRNLLEVIAPIGR